MRDWAWYFFVFSILGVCGWGWTLLLLYHAILRCRQLQRELANWRNAALQNFSIARPTLPPAIF